MADINLYSGDQPLPARAPLPTRRFRAVRRSGLGRLPVRARGYTPLMIEIQRVSEASFCAPSARRIWRQLDQEGIAVDRYTVAKLVRAMGLQTGARSTQPEAAATAQPTDTPEGSADPSPRSAPALMLVQGGRGLRDAGSASTTSMPKRCSLIRSGH